ncbi:peptidase domain-containing ABC transporter [Parahaliea aestuarii]|uniref:Peptidase domain-containing ABC transporter n=1 Tax=Parahaliea aestuarii TaxID=1852021 RepID=A0A5C9A2X1_9GAMM|nr:peptidase domain-containing ABC transporter [Parahaliea aestuarii]TXS95108.1 peptidase domain-containing ABC transporter [Parahaliea aestuarii]
MAAAGAFTLRELTRDSLQRLSRKLPVIRQSEQAECGIACLAMVLGYYGHHCELRHLRNRFRVSAQGTTLKDLMACADNLKLQCRALRLDPSHLIKLQRPGILHWDMNHFVVLKKVGRRYITIHDPASGQRTLSLEQAGQHFTGVALELWPRTEFSVADERNPLRLSAFIGRREGLWSALAQLTGLSLLLQLLALLSPLYLQTVVDDVVVSADTNLLAVLAAAFFLLLLLETGVSILRQLMALRLASRLSLRMAASLFHHLIRLPCGFFSQRHVGDIVSRFSSLDSVRLILTNGMAAAIVDGILTITTLIVMLWYDATLTIVVLAAVAAYWCIRLALLIRVRSLSEEKLRIDARRESSFIEAVRSVVWIKLFHKEEARQAQWQNHLVDSINRDIGLAKLGIGGDSAGRLILGGSDILLIYVAAGQIIDLHISVGMLLAFISFKRHFVSATERLIDQIAEFRLLNVHLDRLADITHETMEPYHRAQQPGGYSPALSGDLEVRNLGFRYNQNQPPVFENLSFTVSRGQTLVVSGQSGRGKSTLLKCLAGLNEADCGEIRLDGTPIQQVPGYRSRMGVVMQNDHLLTGSIAENISSFDSSIDYEQIVTAAKTAGIHGDIMLLPMQYNTLVGDLGTGLSGGQVQRICIARAIYRKPAILLMDEPTNQLDEITEKNVLQNLLRLEMTKILVTHSATSSILDCADTVRIKLE